MNAQPNNPRPNIVLSSLDARRLDKLIESMDAAAFPGKDELEAELIRADIVEPTEVPPNVVTMNSRVTFKVLSSGETFTLTLVYPKDMDNSGDKVSVIAPVGSALLGLAQGDEIEWPKPRGGVFRVRIEDIAYQPERAGDFHL